MDYRPTDSSRGVPPLTGLPYATLSQGASSSQYIIAFNIRGCQYVRLHRISVHEYRTSAIGTLSDGPTIRAPNDTKMVTIPPPCRKYHFIHVCAQSWRPNLVRLSIGRRQGGIKPIGGGLGDTANITVLPLDNGVSRLLLR